ncbi:MAG TPA: serine hydrolase [Albitalea sp.]|nr:serine hydrolase [Albitalea sp.]
MNTLRLRRIALRGVQAVLGALACVLVILVATWMWAGGATAGLVGVSRMLWHGNTTVYDFRLYPSRPLLASTMPAPFKQRAAAAPPALAQQLASTDSLAFLVVQDDAIVYEWYAAGHGAASMSQFFSVSKSILSTLVGMAIDDGLIRSIDQPVTDYVPELAPAGFSRVTLRHLVNMSSGMAYEENDNPFGLHVLMNYTADLPKVILDFKLSGVPGAHYEYKSGDNALLSLVLQRAVAPLSLTAYAQRRLWTPLGMESPGLWSLDREGGMEKAWCCIAGTARDLAKLGRLYLGNGPLNSQRLLSRQWVDQATHLPSGPGGGRVYGFSWWPASPTGTDVMAVGKDGQFLYIDPSHNTLVVRLGRSNGGLGIPQWAALFRQMSEHPW